ncbi:hypothetical protein Lal_00023436 [Lupinus albus]|nr:hypothetical protein Lal_00023436 [Lupinus albus]
MGERRVVLEWVDFDPFLSEVNWQTWEILSKPLNGYNEDLIRDFYVNAYPYQGERAEKVSDTINDYLGNPYSVSSNEKDDYQKMKHDGYLETNPMSLIPMIFQWRRPTWPSVSFIII